MAQDNPVVDGHEWMGGGQRCHVGGHPQCHLVSHHIALSQDGFLVLEHANHNVDEVSFAVARGR